MSGLLEVEGLTKVFPLTRGVLQRRGGEVRALDGLSLSVPPGGAVGLVGESGCGKSTLARCLLRLLEPTAGRISFEGRDVLAFDREQLRRYRRRVQIVFQDPFGTLHPRMTVEQLLAEPLLVHGLVPTRAAARRRGRELLELVGLPGRHGHRHPHELSGGQRQRVAIARAVAVEPSMLILDEPVAALDVSIGAQILNLLADLRDELGVTLLVISHDLSLIRHVAERVAVMYLGTLVEEGPVEQLFTAPQHPYTQALLSAVPLPDPGVEAGRRRLPLPGEVPSAADIPSGCRFHPRCFKAQPVCAGDEPALEEVADGQLAACWFAEARAVL